MPVLEVPIPPQCSNVVRKARMAEVRDELKASGIRSVAFGDLFLADERTGRKHRRKPPPLVSRRTRDAVDDTRA
ncbi:hypothetical protein U7230_07520 [Carboxydochorda subterranea]|uniref:Uncharacterized protein n=1 Tax=Carboxydichorda subterranea TaxID=3109565 RepID=A0ABZ1C437_9FIRM|nr:hypothetical protein [Limnochorda sp. L945t]WRP18832.1 hypothetical protein U7230_07520 [Limnochorda sp. L945t]